MSILIDRSRRIGGHKGLVIPSGCILNLPLFLLDGKSIMSKDHYGHIGTVTGALWTSQGRYFDGVDDYISAGNNAIFQLVTALTLELWVKPGAVSGYLCGMPYTTSWSNPYNAYQVYYDNTNTRLNFNTNSNGTITGAASSAPANAWYHVVYVHRSSGTSWEAYVNTVSYGTSAGGDPSYSGLPKFSIMTRNADSKGEYGQGIIGEVRVYNRALTLDEILRNYQMSKWRYV